MKVVIIGSGNVASILGRLIQQTSHQVLQIVGRNKESVALLADELHCVGTIFFDEMEKEADIYLLAVADAALVDLGKTLRLPNKIVVHTAGAMPLDTLQNVSTKLAVLYPLQSLRKENKELPVIPLLIDSNDADSFVLLELFAKSISNKVNRCNDWDRLKLHLAAVFVNNFTNHLYTLAADFCKEEAIDFSQLQPLIEETALRLRHHSPAQMQTGPALRKDNATIAKHLRLLAANSNMTSVYLKLTESIGEN